MDSDEEQDPVALLMSLDDCQYSSSQSSSDAFLVGFVIANIVGIPYYSGTITCGELVGLVREPLNPYDQNAIKVLNTRSLQVGHIQRSVASVLSPLIDSHKITVEGNVVNSRGACHKFWVPCQVHIFCRHQEFEKVISAISRGGLLLNSEMDPGFGLSEAMVVKEKIKKSTLENLDEIFKLVDDNVNKRGKLGALEPPKEVIKSELFLLQKEGLWWLMNRENSGDLPPFWEEKDGEYMNSLTNYHSNQRPEPLRGGILADDMGLGKTLTLLSLIAFDKVDSRNINDRVLGEQTCEVEEGVSMLGGKKGKRARGSGKGTSGQRKQRDEDSLSDDNVKGRHMAETDKYYGHLGTKTTLIVCPPVVFSTWITQLEEHTRCRSFKIYLYYGERTKEAEELKKQDIVLTTYSTLASEDSWDDSPIKMIEWWRVILDEAQIIKNANAQQSRAVTNLNAKRRWVVTGTPVHNGFFDLFSLMVFLQSEPFSIKIYW